MRRSRAASATAEVPGSGGELAKKTSARRAASTPAAAPAANVP